MPKKSIANKFIQARLSMTSSGKPISQKEMAELIGIDKSTYSKYENTENKRIPRPDVLKKIAEVTNKNIEWFLNDENTSINLPECPQKPFKCHPESSSIPGQKQTLQGALQRILEETNIALSLISDESKDSNIVIKSFQKIGLMADISGIENNDIIKKSNTNMKIIQQEGGLPLTEGEKLIIAAIERMTVTLNKAIEASTKQSIAATEAGFKEQKTSLDKILKAEALETFNETKTSSIKRNKS